jgi:hypothetical protein
MFELPATKDQGMLQHVNEAARGQTLIRHSVYELTEHVNDVVF